MKTSRAARMICVALALAGLAGAASFFAVLMLSPFACLPPESSAARGRRQTERFSFSASVPGGPAERSVDPLDRREEIGAAAPGPERLAGRLAAIAVVVGERIEESPLPACGVAGPGAGERGEERREILALDLERAGDHGERLAALFHEKAADHGAAQAGHPRQEGDEERDLAGIENAQEQRRGAQPLLAQKGRELGGAAPDRGVGGHRAEQV